MIQEDIETLKKELNENLISRDTLRSIDHYFLTQSRGILQEILYTTEEIVIIVAKKLNDYVAGKRIGNNLKREADENDLLLFSKIALYYCIQEVSFVFDDSEINNEITRLKAMIQKAMDNND